MARVPAASNARGLPDVSPSQEGGRRESRAPIAPAVVRTGSARVDHRFNRIDPAFPARWGYGLLRALPGDRLVCHRRLADRASRPGWACNAPQDLTPASGRQNHTTSPSATVSAERSPGLVRSGKTLAKAGCSAVRPRAGRSLKGPPGLPCDTVCAPDAVASTASHRAFVTTRDPPLCRVGRRELVELICPTAKAKYFFRWGWTGFCRAD
jgi:hypothetical protein